MNIDKADFLRRYIEKGKRLFSWENKKKERPTPSTTRGDGFEEENGLNDQCPSLWEATRHCQHGPWEAKRVGSSNLGRRQDKSIT